ncbi:hypothetical protein RB201_36065 [Streptomyces sp. S1A(2023)]
MELPSLPAYASSAVVVAAVLFCYRFAISPTVRTLSSRPTVWRATLATAVPSALLAFLPAPDPGPFRWFVVFVIALLTWQGITSDYDVTQPIGPQRQVKVVLLLLAVASCFWAPALLPWLAVYCGRLRGWKHHAMMPLRLLKAYLAWYFMVAVLDTPGSSPGLVLVLCCVSLSHYVKPAWSKARLGPRPWSWAWHNRTHYLTASAYSWGWARFLPPQTVTGILRRARAADRPLNILTVLVETAGLIAFHDRHLLVAVLAATAVFNLAVVLASGISSSGRTSAPTPLSR